MSDRNTAVGIFAAHTWAEIAAQELQRSGLDVKKLSVAGQEQFTDDQMVDYNRLFREMRRHARTYDLATMQPPD